MYLWVCAVVVGLFAAVLILRRIHKHRESSFLKKPLPFREHRRTAIGDAKDGQLVMVGGRVRYVGKPLRSPVTNRECFFWSVVVRRLTDPSEGDPMFILHASETQSFAIEDETGRAFVEKTVLSDQFVLPPEEEKTPYDKEAIVAFMAAHDRVVNGTERTFFYSESVLQEGEEVAALGQGEWEVDPDPAGAIAKGSGYRQGPKRLALKPTQEGKVFVGNHALILED